MRDLFDHFGILLSACGSESRMHTGEPNVCRCLSFGSTWTQENSEIGDSFLLPTGASLIMSFANRIANGQRLAVIASGHLCLAWSVIVLAACWRSLILFSALLFWWCALTAQNEIGCPELSTSAMKLLLEKMPLSAREWPTVTPRDLACHSNALFASIVWSAFVDIWL